MESWALTLAYWLHMAATVVWVGGLLFQAVVLNPVLVQSVTADALQPLLYRLRRRFQPLAWLSLAILIGSGLLQMSANPNYLGLFQFGNLWSQAILAKHLAIGGMVLLAAYQTWWLGPQLERALLLGAKQAGSEATTVVDSLRRLTWLNSALSLLVLALTAIARTA
jgi:uncharacterized membrane protein